MKLRTRILNKGINGGGNLLFFSNVINVTFFSLLLGIAGRITIHEPDFSER